MKRRDAKLRTIAKLIRSLEGELDVLESAHRVQFETTASLKDKLSASKRTNSSLTKARRYLEHIDQILVEPDP